MRLDDRSVPAVVLKALSEDLFLGDTVDADVLQGGVTDAATELSTLPLSDLSSSFSVRVSSSLLQLREATPPAGVGRKHTGQRRTFVLPHIASIGSTGHRLAILHKIFWLDGHVTNSLMMASSGVTIFCSKHVSIK